MPSLDLSDSIPHNDATSRVEKCRVFRLMSGVSDGAKSITIVADNEIGTVIQSKREGDWSSTIDRSDG